MNSYRRVTWVFEVCLFFLISGLISECGITKSGPATSSGVFDTLKLGVNFTDPMDGDSGVPVNTNLIASFNEGLDSSTITSSTVILQQGTAQVAGTVSFANDLISFSPESNLMPNTVYTVKITPGVTDLEGNTMTTPEIWTFKTGSIQDTTTPRVVYTFPGQSAVDIALNVNPSVTFSEEMDNASITTKTFTLKRDTIQIPGSVTFNEETALFTPAMSLMPNTVYTAEIHVDARDMAGNATKTSTVWTFKTVSIPDTIAPQVTYTFPRGSAVNVALNINPTATFSKMMDSLSITSTTFVVMQDTARISGSVSFIGTTAIFTPLTDLLPEATYTASITVGVKDVAGNPLRDNVTWTFKTGAE